LKREKKKDANLGSLFTDTIEDYFYSILTWYSHHDPDAPDLDSISFLFLLLVLFSDIGVTLWNREIAKGRSQIRLGYPWELGPR
jgi:hypothetical protein